MLRNSRFFALVENRITRYRIGSFLVGDQIRFLDSIKSHPAYKALPVAEIELLNKFIDQSKAGDIILKIAGLNQAPFIQGTPQAAPCSFDIGVDVGGGRYYEVITLPGELINAIERVDIDPNNVAQTLPPNAIITHPSYSEPVEVTPEMINGKDGQAIPEEQPVHQMPTTNVKIKASSAPEVDYKKDIKVKQKINNATIDTKSLA